MPTVNARFTADFDSFYGAVQRADYELKLFSSSSEDVDKKLTTMVNRFSGVRIIEQATLMTQAIEEIGGISSLTAKELESVGATATEAANKIKALGGEVPADIQRYADAAKDAKGWTEMWSGAIDTAVGFLGAMGVQLSLSGLVNFGKEILNTADQLIKMSVQTGLTVDEVQRLQAVADETSVPMSSLVTAFQTLEERLGKEGAQGGVAAALRRLGISFEDFMSASPYERILMVSDGYQALEDRTEKAQIRTELFGRSSRQVVALLEADVRGIAEQAQTMSQSTAEYYDAIGDGLKKFWRETVVLSAKSLEELMTDVTDTWRAIQLEWSQGTRNLASWWSLAMSKLKGEDAGKKAIDEVNASFDALGASVAGLGSGKAARDLELSQRKFQNWSAGVIGGVALSTDEIAKVEKELTKSVDAQVKAHGSGKKAADEHAKALKDYQDALTRATGFSKPLIDTLWELDGALVESAIQLNRNGASWSDIQKIYALSATEIKAVEAASKGLGDDLKSHIPTYDKTTIALKNIGVLMPELADGSEKVRSALEDLEGNWITTDRIITDTGAHIGGTTIPMFSTLTKGVLPQNAKAIKDAEKSYREFGSYLEDELPKQILGAIMGGGDVIKTIGASVGSFLTDSKSRIGETITETATSIVSKVPAIGGAIGGLVGTVMGPLGTLVGSFAGDLIGKVFGSDPEKKVNPVREAFVQAAGGLHELNVKANDAGLTLDALLGAKTMDEYTAAVDKLNAAFGATEQLDTARESYIGIAGGLEALGQQAWTAGTNLDAMLNAKTVEEYNAAQKDLSDAFAFQQTALDDVVKTAEKYGITIEQLGPALQKQELDKQAQQLFKDFETLNAAGIDTTVIAEGMADAINAYVDRALRMGTEIPIAMKPMLEDMARTGQLVDENGNKIEDLEGSGISFSMTMSQGFQAMIDSVERLTTVISRSLGVALDTTRQQLTTMPRSLNVDVRYNDPGFQAPGANVEIPGYQHGTEGHFVDFGRGSLVMLHGKEAVVPQGQPLSRSPAVGNLGASVNITINAQGAFFDTPGDLQRLATKIDEALTAKYGLSNRLRVA